MPAGVSAWTPLANLTLGSNQTTVTFSSISGSYRDLVLVIVSTGTSAGQNTYFQANGVSTGTAYAGATLESNGSSNASLTFNQNLGIYSVWNGSDIGAGDFTNTTVNILDYATTDKHKQFLIRVNRPTGGMVALTAGRFGNTGAITTLTINSTAGQWASGSSFALYGVSS